MALQAKHVKSPFPREREVAAAAIAIAAGSIIQTQDGRAAVLAGLKGVAVNDGGSFYTEGRYVVPKTANVAILDGGQVFWDRVNAKAHFKLVTGGFFIGTAIGDYAAADTEMVIELNARPHYVVDWGSGAWDSVAVKTAGVVLPNPAAGLAGTDPGGSNARFVLDTTAEAQKADTLSKSAIATADGPILEARIDIENQGNNVALDINFGLASATHASDADQIAQHVFFHLDGNALNILAQSKDSTTTVAATDTTKLAVVGTYADFWIDARNPANVKLYIDGVQVLAGTTFRLDNAAGPLKALVHAEKTASATPADVRVEYIRVRSTDL